MKFASVRGIGFYGGEPLAHESFPSILEYASNLGFQIRVVTNGFYLQSDRVKQAILRANNVVECRISLNAATEKTHTRLHRPLKPCFYNIIRAIEKIASFGVRIGISFLLEEENHREVLKAAQISKECGCKFLELRPKTKLHGEGLIPLSPTARLVTLNQVEMIRSNLTDKDFELKVPDWYINYLKFGVYPSTAKDYPRCFVSLFRITVSPPDPGVVSLCAYRRMVNGYTSPLEVSLMEWAQTKRIEIFNRIDPRIKC
jgi:MoaA/NifB/PqqE/SkfB family radical SAM enzyme